MTTQSDEGIKRVIASIESLHGGPRDQIAKHRQYCEALNRMRKPPALALIQKEA